MTKVPSRGRVGRVERYLFALYIALLVTSVAGGTKTVTIAGLDVAVSVFSFMGSFVIVDLVNRHYRASGGATPYVKPGFLAMLVSVVFFQLFVHIPPNEHFEDMQQGYADTLVPPLWFYLAGFTAFLISQFLNMRFFRRLDDVAALKRTGVSSFLSSTASQLVDTAIFIPLGFLFLPQLFVGKSLLPADSVPSYLRDQFLVKAAFAAVLWPVFFVATSYLNSQPTEPPQA